MVCNGLSCFLMIWIAGYMVYNDIRGVWLPSIIHEWDLMGIYGLYGHGIYNGL